MAILCCLKIRRLRVSLTCLLVIGVALSNRPVSADDESSESLAPLRAAYQHLQHSLRSGRMQFATESVYPQSGRRYVLQGDAAWNGEYLHVSAEAEQTSPGGEGGDEAVRAFRVRCVRAGGKVLIWREFHETSAPPAPHAAHISFHDDARSVVLTHLVPDVNHMWQSLLPIKTYSPLKLLQEEFHRETGGEALSRRVLVDDDTITVALATSSRPDIGKTVFSLNAGGLAVAHRIRGTRRGEPGSVITMEREWRANDSGEWYPFRVEITTRDSPGGEVTHVETHRVSSYSGFEGPDIALPLRLDSLGRIPPGAMVVRHPVDGESASWVQSAISDDEFEAILKEQAKALRSDGFFQK